MKDRLQLQGIGITGRLMALIAATLTVAVGAAVWLLAATTEREFHVFLASDRPVDTRTAPVARALQAAWSNGEEAQAILERNAAADADTLWLLVRSDGTASWAPSSLEVALSRQGDTRRVSITRESPPKSWILMVTASSGKPVVVDGERVAELHALGLAERVRMAPEADFLEGNRRAALWLFAAIVPLALLAAWVVGRRLTRPLRSLTAATGHLSAGELGYQVPVEGGGEIEELARRFNEMSRTLAESDQQRRRMISDIAHELRTPLTGLRCNLELLRDGVTSPGPGAIDGLHGEVLDLQQLVDDLQVLTLAQARQLSIEPAPCTLFDVVSAARETVKGEARIEVDMAGDLTLETDPRRLRQVLVNLLENALRYSEPGDPIRVSAHQDESIVIDVLDRGPGVAPEELARLFERFYRTDSARSRASGGTGLGLAICREIVGLLGGQISASLPETGGLCVSIRLPATLLPSRQG